MKDGFGRAQSILLLGGTSEIGRATVRRLVSSATRTVFLASRKPEQLETEAEELRRLGVRRVEPLPFDAEAFEDHEALVDSVFDRGEDLDVAILAFGVLGDQAAGERDPAAALQVARVNYLGAVSVLVPLARRFERQGHGDIVVLSSVAAERGRRSNFVYGSSKAGLDVFCQGLADRLHGSGVRLMVVRPGFVRTKMTAGRAKAPLSVGPEDVARAIEIGLRRGDPIVWVPPSLRPVMSALRHLPRPVFRRLEI